MSGLEYYDRLFVITAFAIQIVLLVYFAVRKWKFDTAMRLGSLVYALAMPALVIGLVLLLAGKPWPMWLSGLLFTAWAILGYAVDFQWPVAWRSPILWPVYIPYVLLYLSSLMLYWWPLGTILRPLWFIYGVLFAISTVLNVTSHRG